MPRKFNLAAHDKAEKELALILPNVVRLLWQASDILAKVERQIGRRNAANWRPGWVPEVRSVRKLIESASDFAAKLEADMAPTVPEFSFTHSMFVSRRKYPKLKPVRKKSAA